MAEARSTSTTAPPLVRLPRPVSVQSLAQAGPSSHAGNLGNGTPRKSLALAAIAAATGQSVDRAASRASSAMSDVDRMEARSPSMASEVDQIMSSSIDTLSTNPTAPDVHAESSSQQLSKSQKKKFKAQERKRRHKEETRAGSQQTSHTLQRNQPQPQASTSKPTAVVENAAPSSSQRESSKVDSCTEWIQIPSKVQKAHQRKASQAHGHRQTPGAAAAALSTIPPRRNITWEPPQTVFASMSYLFNEPGSRLHIDDRTGRREMTLHISLKPIPELRRLERTGPPRQYMKQARTARDRHRVAEIVCFVRFEHEWELPAPSKQYDNVEWVFNVKLKPNQKPVRVENSTARQQRLAREVSAEKQPDDVEGKRRATQDTALQKATSAETSSSRPLRVQPRRAQSLQVELPRLPRPSSAPVPDEKGHTRSASRLSASAGDAPAEKPPTTAPEGPHDLASAQLREMVLNQATESPIFVPSVEEQMLAQSMRSSSISGSAYDQSSLGQPSPFVPSDLSSVPPPPLPLPPPGQPFYGPDGMTYVVDHVTGQPQVFNAPPPWLQHYPYPDQGFMDYGPPPPLYMASGPNTPSFFTPPKSSKLEIKAPPGKRRALHASSMSASSSVTGASERTNEPTFTVPNHHYGYRPPYNPYDYGYGPPPFDQNEYHPPGVPRGYPSMMGHSMPPPGMPSHPLHHQHINPQMTEEYPHHQSSTP